MSAGWLARLRAKSAAPLPAPTDKTDERGDLSALSVPPEGGAAKTSSAAAAAPVVAANDEPPARPYRLTPAEMRVAHADPWDDAACARFEARARHLMRLGYGAQDAEDLAERLHFRDVHADYRHLCLECRHYRPGRCGNSEAAGLLTAEVGRDLATMFCECPGFGSV